MDLAPTSLVSRAVLVIGLVIAACVAAVTASADVGGALRTIGLQSSIVNGVDINRCDSQGGTSVAVVQGSKLAGVDAAKYPVLLAASCLDNGNSTAAIEHRARINFVDPAAVTSPGSGALVKSIVTKINGVVSAPANGWAHIVNRPNSGDLLACGNDGTIYAIDFSQFNTVTDGTATAVPRPTGLPANCKGLAWDAEESMIYQGVDTNGAIGVVRFPAPTTTTATLDKTYNVACGQNGVPSGIAVTGGVLLVACDGTPTILRLAKDTGTALTVNGSVTAATSDFSSFACDPVTFQTSFKDAMWSRTGADGNSVVALEFPAFTCGLPSTATVLRAGLSVPGSSGPGQNPNPACFDGNGIVIDADGDGIPDCWETAGIDFDGDGTVDLQLCVSVDTNGDGVPDANECASPTKKDLFVEIDWMTDHKPNPLALSQSATSLATSGVQSVRSAFAAAPVSNPDSTSGIRLHFQVDAQVTFTTLGGGSASHVGELVFPPCTPPAVKPDGSLNVKSLADAADFDTIKEQNFGTAAERVGANAVNVLNAKRLVFRYMLFGHNQVGLNQGGASNSGCAELGGDDAAITLGAFTSVDGHTKGTRDEQAGTIMHELGHTLNLRHGGVDNINCKPNYRSVMSYTRQFGNNPIPGRRLDYSRAADPVLLSGATGVLTDTALLEKQGLGTDLSLSAIAGTFLAKDQIAFGPSAFSVVTTFPLLPNTTSTFINWNRSKQGPNPTFQDAGVSADINSGPGGCDGGGSVLTGHDDWDNLLYRASAALDFAAGVHSANSAELVAITSEQADELFFAGDLDANGIGDAVDCGTFTCTHRIDIKPSFPLPKVIKPGAESTITIVIFSEKSGNQVWDAGKQLVTNATLKLSGEDVVLPVKTNQNGQGTCSTQDKNDPETGQKDGVKDALCQFPTTGLPIGTYYGVVSGQFVVGGEIRAFRARQLIKVE